MAQGNHVGERIEKFILQRFPLARKRQLTVDEKLLERGIIDSMGVLDLVAFLEKEFSIAISDEELTPENFQTITGLSEFVRGKQAPDE